jgi:hypothetical protein
MPSVQSEWIHVLVLGTIAVIICATYYAASRTSENFETWPGVVDYGQSVFNPLVVLTDPTRPNFIGSDSPSDIAAANQRIVDATRTPRAKAGPGDTGLFPGGPMSGLGLYGLKPPYEIPANSASLANAKRCAEVTSCEMLMDSRYAADCGFCIGGGTNYTGKNPGTYTGGLYLSPADAANQSAANYTSYKPSYGLCNPDSKGNVMFQAGIDPNANCIKAVRRKTCRDTKSFTSSRPECVKTPEGTFVYQDPVERTFPASLRVASPTGITTTVQIFAANGTTSLASGTSNGGDVVVTWGTATEGAMVYVLIGQAGNQNGRRGIAAQWEGDPSRRVPFDVTIQGVVVGNSTTDYTKISGQTSTDAKELRKFGSLQNGTQLTTTSTQVTGSAYWVWGKNPTMVYFITSSFIPGLFQTPTYTEDNGLLISSFPLVGSADTAAKLRLGPCNQTGQTAGNYSTACLQELYESAGGTPDGDLVKNGLYKLNKNAANENQTADQISNMLGEKYRIATTGKRTSTAPAETAEVINAATKDLFGFNASSPCEQIVEKSDGTVGYSPITGMTKECATYLWGNLGLDDQGTKGRTPSATLSATYTPIGERWSGLRNAESTPEKRATFPFQTCQPSGTAFPGTAYNGAITPRNPNGTPNWSSLNVAAAQTTMNNLYQAANTVGPNQAASLESCYGVQAPQ